MKRLSLHRRLIKCAVTAAAFALTFAMGLPAQAMAAIGVDSGGEEISGVNLNLYNYTNDANTHASAIPGYVFFNSASGLAVDSGASSAGEYNKPVMYPTLSTETGHDGYPLVYAPYFDGTSVPSVTIDGKSTPLLSGTLMPGSTAVAYAIDGEGNKILYTKSGGTWVASTYGSGQTIVPSTYSMEYLFKTGTGSFHAGSSAVGGKLFKPTGDGGHVYDSSKNAAYWNSLSSNFILYDHIVRPSWIPNTSELADEWSNFLPFNVLNDTTATEDDGSVTKPAEISSAKTAFIKSTTATDLWFGMTVDFEFYMPKNGKLNATTPMRFDFHGDDDVFVYINGVLVLDIGGTHAAQDGWIDFSTGVVFDPTCITTETVTIYSATAPAVGSKTNYASGTFKDLTQYEVTAVSDLGSNQYSVTRKVMNYKTLRQIFEAAKGTDFDPTHFNGNTLANYSENSLKFFYMERGGNISYCRLKFNMPVLSGDLNVLKHVEEDTLTPETQDKDYRFTLCDKANNPVKNHLYTIVKSNGSVVSEDALGNPLKTDDNGAFYLKANEIASFSFAPEMLGGKEYVVKEDSESFGACGSRHDRLASA